MGLMQKLLKSTKQVPLYKYRYDSGRWRWGSFLSPGGMRKASCSLKDLWNVDTYRCGCVKTFWRGRQNVIQGRTATTEVGNQWMECIKKRYHEIIHMDIRDKGLCFKALSLAECTFSDASSWDREIIPFFFF